MPARSYRDFVDAFAEYLSTRFTVVEVSGGRQWRIKDPCPFCGDSRDDVRLYYNPMTGVGDCKRCGEVFWPIKFVAAAEGCGASAAAVILRGLDDGYVVERPRLAAEEGGVVFPKTVSAWDSKECVEYLARRGFTRAHLDQFDLGYCIGNTKIGGKTYNTLGRLYIPIRALDGTVESWQARDVTGRSTLRYLFPPNFRGSEYLYNAHNVERGADYLIICEGAFDAWGWVRAGIRNVVATFGKKVSEAQVDIIRSLEPKVVFNAWDGDAVKERFKFCEEHGHRFDILNVELGDRDADEMSKGDLVAALASAKRYDWNDKVLSLLKKK